MNGKSFKSGKLNCENFHKFFNYNHPITPKKAHRSHRKAEYYSRCHQFSKAIFHYTKAIRESNFLFHLFTKFSNLNFSYMIIMYVNIKL